MRSCCERKCFTWIPRICQSRSPIHQRIGKCPPITNNTCLGAGLRPDPKRLNPFTGAISMTFRYRRLALLFGPMMAAALCVWAGVPAPDPAPKPTVAAETPVAHLFEPRPFRGFDDPET